MESHFFSFKAFQQKCGFPIFCEGCPRKLHVHVKKKKTAASAHNSIKQASNSTTTTNALFYWMMFYPLLIRFLFSLAVGEAAFCGPAFRDSSFGKTAGWVHSIKQTTSVLYGNTDDVSEMDKKMQKALEKKDAEIKQKDAEILDLRFAKVITKIDTAVEALTAKIDTLNTKIDKTFDKIDKKFDKIDKMFAIIYGGLVVIICLTLSDKFPSLIAAFLKL
jgi:hypothetical protein